MKKIIYIFFALLLFNTPVWAAEWDDKSKAEMQQAIAYWFHAYELKDVNKVLAGNPPGFIRYDAYKFKITPLQMESQLREVLKQLFEGLKSVAIDVAPEKIIYRQAANGELYALIPHTIRLVSIHDEATSEKLLDIAFRVNGAWYFSDAEDPNIIDNLLTIYPYFKDADLSLSEGVN